MSPRTAVVVRGKDGLRGTLEPIDRADAGAGTRVVVLEDGRRMVVPAELLVAREGGEYDLLLDPAKLDSRVEAVIPVVAEEVEVGKRRVETGRVRISKLVREHEEVIDEALARDDVSVERVTVNRIADDSTGVRQEGDTTIIPLLEEVLVVEKRLMVREELRITRRRTVNHKPQTVTLRKEEAVVETIDGHEEKFGSS